MTVYGEPHSGLVINADTGSRLAWRAPLVFPAVAGTSDRSIAQATDVKYNRAMDLGRGFEMTGIAGLGDEERLGRPSASGSGRLRIASRARRSSSSTPVERHEDLSVVGTANGRGRTNEVADETEIRRAGAHDSSLRQRSHRRASRPRVSIQGNGCRREAMQ